MQLGGGISFKPKAEPLSPIAVGGPVGLPVRGIICARQYDGIKQAAPIVSKPQAPPKLEDLSAYAKAAIVALQSREEIKAAAKLQEKEKNIASKADAKAEREAAKAAIAAAKVGAKADAKTKKEAAKKEAVRVKKEPSAVMKRPARAYMQAPKSLPALSLKVDEDGPTYDHNGGRIYWKANSKAFRVIRVKGEYGTEKRIRWSKWCPIPKDWKLALNAIDSYKR